MKSTVKEAGERSKGLSNYEQETIINFNKEDQVAYIFTYEKKWQRHLEGKLGLKPKSDNGLGGRDYELPKDRIPMPRAKRVLSANHKKKLTSTLAKARKAKQATLL